MSLFELLQLMPKARLRHVSSKWISMAHALSAACHMLASMSYAGQIYYTNEVVREMLLNGTGNIDSRREAHNEDRM